MTTTFDFGFREVLKEFHGGARLHVLMAMVLHSNVRNRCWPSMRGLAKETGYALAAVNDAKNWLEEHGAIEIVKYEHRVNEEREQAANHLQNVYQLTGVIKFNGKTYPIQYMGKGEPQLDTSDSYVPQIETSRNETLICDTEVVTSVKVVQEKKKKEIAPAVADANTPATSQSSLATSKQDSSATLITTPPPKVAPKGSPTPRALTPKQLEQEARIKALSDCGFAPPLTSPDFSNYNKKIAILAQAGITQDLYADFVKWVRSQSKSQDNWKVSLNSLVSNNRPSEFMAAWLASPLGAKSRQNGATSDLQTPQVGTMLNPVRNAYNPLLDPAYVQRNESAK